MLSGWLARSAASHLYSGEPVVQWASWSTWYMLVFPTFPSAHAASIT